jgi:CIC family chloride channel protein
MLRHEGAMAAHVRSWRKDVERLRVLTWRRFRQLLMTLQRDLRSSEPTQIALCALLGGLVGGLVELVHGSVELLHRVNFRLVPDALLSAGEGVDPFRIVIVPAVGGLLLGLTALLWRRFRPGEIVDPIEANALYGGRMSLTDSIRLGVSTVISNAAGASLGMEAGYAQFGSGFFSWLGQYFHLRRADLRVFVTSGAAAAIAAAFNAPLAGAFYGYELVLGSYMPRALAPVAAASVCGTLAQRAIGGEQPIFSIASAVPLTSASYVLFALLGVAAAGVAVLSMMGVTWCERTMRRLPLPEWLRPVLGGALLSVIAVLFPQVLGSGHGAIQDHFQHGWTMLPLLLLLAAKLVASAISVGSGFRGGLFSSSLFLGCLFGEIFAGAVAWIDPALAVQRSAFLLVGMGAVAAGIVGAPLTMAFLVLEGTGDFPVAVGVLVGVTLASTIVRLTFGYSFATWRFHVRGLSIRGAHDVGWIAELTAARLMRSDPKVVPSGISLAELRAKYPVGAVKRVFVADPNGIYAGVIDMAVAHDPQLDDTVDAVTVADLMEPSRTYLLPNDNVRTALRRFEEGHTESLPVLAGGTDLRIIGYMTEAYALRRYAQELERRRSAELGEQDLFSLGQTPTPR